MDRPATSPRRPGCITPHDVSAKQVKAVGLVALLAAAGCTTDLDKLVDDGIDDGGPMHGDLPDAEVDQFPPPIMEPTFQDPDPIVDPAGTFAFTLLHGIVDAQRIYFCVIQNGEVQGDPWPEQGLRYGERWVGGGLPDVDPEQDDLQLLVIDADDDYVAGRTCSSIVADPLTVVTEGAAISTLVHSNAVAGDAGSDGGLADSGAAEAGVADAGSSPVVDAAAVSPADAAVVDTGVEPSEDAGPPLPPAIRVAYLPVIPAGTLITGGSYLLTLAGCLGGDYFTTPDERAICGSSYFPDRPTLTPMLVRMSRLVTFGNPSLQFLQASLAAGPVTLRSMPGRLNNGTQITIASEVPAGVIAPYPPIQSVAPLTYGSPLGVGSLELESEVGSTWSDSWGSALDDLDIEALAGLKGYTIVFLGPNPWLQSNVEDPWWHDPRFVLVENSPVP